MLTGAMLEPLPGPAPTPPAVRAESAAAAASDVALMRRAASGDAEAVRVIHRAHVRRIHRTVCRILGATDPDVEDVVQQVFLAALEGAARFDGRSSLATWLTGIAIRRALDEARARARRRRWARLGEWLGLVEEDGRAASSVELRDEAESVLAVLSPEQRAVFVLHEVEGFTLAELSAMTGTGISTLHARLMAARRRLSAALEDGGRP